MSALIEGLSLVLLAVGVGFFLAGTAGVLRFGSVLARVHAVTKADNLGLGFVAIALALRADSATAVVRLGLIWLLALAASAAACHLIAREAAGSSPVKGGDR